MGKLLGALFGFLFLGFFGAIIGLFIGHQFDKARRMSFGGFNSPFGASGAEQAQRQEAFFNAAFSVMGHVAKSKGQVRSEDIQLATMMMDRMNLSELQKSNARTAFSQGKSSDFPLESTLAEVRQFTGGRHDLLQFFLELQIMAAFADGDIHPSEREVLHRIAQGIGFTAQQLERRLKMHEAAFRFQQNGNFGGQQGGYSGGSSYSAPDPKQQLADAYEILGVKESDDGKTIKRAYRKLMNEHHPDKLMAKGLPPEMMKVAKEKSQEIQQAYEIIKNAKGFK